MSFIWNKHNLKWFETAVSETEFYSKIVAKCSHIIDKESTFIDIGCGTGELSICLSYYTKFGTAVDINKLAIDRLKHKCVNLGINNISFLVTDWLKHNFFSRYDLVFLCYINGFIPNIKKLKALCKKYLVLVLPKSSKSNPFRIGEFCQIKSKHNETVYDVIKYLQLYDINFEFINHCEEFGQPFESFEEYTNFLRFYFKINDTVTINKIASKYLIKTERGFYLPNIRESGIIIIKGDDLVE